jgi:uncharacterized protein with PIN domain
MSAHIREVSVRFYGALNDFLAPPRRGRRFAHALREAASVKDVIEALGVPHPEVDAIVIDGVAAAFTARLQGGERVSVYPRLREFDIGGLRRLSGDPPEPARFAVDAHLNKLASWLRLAGFDAVVEPDDVALAAIAAREGRVLLTRDVALLKRSVVTHGYWVRHTDPERQLSEVLHRFGLGDRMDAFTRCVRCNSLLDAVTAEAVAERLPPRTRAQFSDFRQCPSCSRVYWKGSHYTRLRALLDRVRAI